MKISIIIPCYNEKDTINEIVKKVRNADVLHCEKEIIVIDDNSNDGTSTILDELKKNFAIAKLIKNSKNQGKGFSIKEGIKNSNGDIIIIQDADLEYDPNDYNKLLEPILDGYADAVYGSRFLGSSRVRVLYFWHRVGNFILTFLSNMFSNLNLTDMEVCYKAFKSSVLKNINLKENRFGFEPEVTAKLSKVKNLRLYEVSVSYYGRKYSEGKKITWKDGFSALRCILIYNLFND
jgi:glycosyltransferase involved in cell wall biosynthesis